MKITIWTPPEGPGHNVSATDYIRHVANLIDDGYVEGRINDRVGWELDVHASEMKAPGPMFEPYSDNSPRWRCRVCGRTGYNTAAYDRGWMATCERGHTECPTCNKPLALLADGRPRRHGRCPGRKPGQVD